MALDIPRLAIMGHPNAGKSSVVATLTENDRIAIDQRAGTTTESDVYPVIIDGQTVIEFIDTPGFQNPSAILEWFQAHGGQSDLAAAFVAAHRTDPLFAHDCALLEPVAAGAGIILVVDGSKRIKEKDRIEIELLRLTARPRMAILNNLTNSDRHLEQWQNTLSKGFNSVREFNAHRATYAERIKLLSALKSIDQRWEQRLEQTIDAFERDWERRTDQAATTILDLLREALAFRYSESVKNNKVLFQSGRDRSRPRSWPPSRTDSGPWKSRPRNRSAPTSTTTSGTCGADSILCQDLLSEEVNKALGISRRQLATVGVGHGGRLRGRHRRRGGREVAGRRRLPWRRGGRHARPHGRERPGQARHREGPRHPAIYRRPGLQSAVSVRPARSHHPVQRPRHELGPWASGGR